MDITQRLQIIEQLLPILYQYRASGQAKAAPEYTDMLKNVYGDIFGIYNINAACPTCIINYLEMLQAYKDSVQHLVQPQIQETQQTTELVEKVKKGKQPKNCCKGK